MAQAPPVSKYAAQFRKSDGVVVSLWRGSGNKGLPPETADIGIKELTEVEHKRMHSQGLTHPGGGDPVNKVVGNNVVLQSDPRRKLRFTPSRVDAGVGDAVPNVTVTALNPGGNPDPSFNGALRIALDDGKVLRLDFVNGVASLPVTSLNSYERRIDNSREFTVEAPLEVRIDTVNLS